MANSLVLVYITVILFVTAVLAEEDAQESEPEAPQLYDRTTHYYCNGKSYKRSNFKYKKVIACCEQQMAGYIQEEIEDPTVDKLVCCDKTPHWTNRIDAHCCGTELIDFATHMCHNGKKVEIPEPLKEKELLGICKTEDEEPTVYDGKTYFCCENQLHLLNGSSGCCNEQLYNIEEKFCCFDKAYRSELGHDKSKYVYAIDLPEIEEKSETSETPDSTKRKRFSAVDACCQQQYFNTEEQICCSDGLRKISRSGKKPLSCCGEGFIYDVQAEVCVDNYVVPRDPKMEYCGPVEAVQPYDPNTNICHENEVKPVNSDQGEAFCPVANANFQFKDQACCKTMVVDKNEDEKKYIEVGCGYKDTVDLDPPTLPAVLPPIVKPVDQGVAPEEGVVPQEDVAPEETISNPEKR